MNFNGPFGRWEGDGEVGNFMQLSLVEQHNRRGWTIKVVTNPRVENTPIVAFMRLVHQRVVKDSLGVNN